MDLHAEDRYNFNPDSGDIATGIPDDANGQFELTGLGKQFDSYANLRRLLQWKGFDLGVGMSATPHTTRLRQPSNNRQPYNHI